MASPTIEFLKVFIPLFVVIDPFGSLVIFVAVTGTLSAEKKESVSREASLYGAAILVFFALVGGYIIYFFGISIAALEISGGLILLIMGIEMVREGDKPPSAGGSSVEDVGIVPLATPMLAGPGAISLVIILMKGSVVTKAFTLVSIVILFALVYLFFHYSVRIATMMGPRLIKAITRIFGLLVAGFAIQYMIDALILLQVLK